MRTQEGVTREHRMGRRVSGRRGAALVEFAIVLPLLMVLLLGIMEFGMIMRDYLMLGHGAREGARTAAVGGTVSEIRQQVINTAALRDLKPEMIQSTYFDKNTETWVAVGDLPSGQKNAVPSDSIIRVTIKSYPHRMVTGSFFALLPGYKDGFFTLKDAGLAMRRE
jgi:Flp pilus assembly protein TadG